MILFVLRALQLEALLGLASDASSTPTPAELVAPVISTLAAVYSVIVPIASGTSPALFTSTVTSVNSYSLGG